MDREIKQIDHYQVPLSKFLTRFKDYAKKHLCLQMINLQQGQEKINDQHSNIEDLEDVNNLDYPYLYVESFNTITCQLIQSVKQSEFCSAIAFNNSGSIMVAGSFSDIKVWAFDKGRVFEQQILKYKGLSCLVFSKKCNWFASGGYDYKIQCWKEQPNKDWVSVQPSFSFFDKNHTNIVQGLILNNNEDQLISAGMDCQIKVWKVNCEKNQFSFGYTLENKHQKMIYGISLNKSETSLLSCSYDHQIILWVKGLNTKWQYQNHVTTDDVGLQICFISNNEIAWQQYSQCLTRVFKIEDGILIEKPELQLKLNDADSNYKFYRTIFNQKRKVMFQKHHNHISFVRKSGNGWLNIEKNQIELQTFKSKQCQNACALTDDGEYLVIWDASRKDFQVFDITYN